MNDPPRLSDSVVLTLIGAVSAVLLGFLFWLIYVFQGMATAPDWTLHLPAVNATFNAISTALIVAAVVAIRARRVTLHRNLIIAALASSALFLVGYITSHAFHGDTRFLATGWIRPVYFAILISHILLSMAVVPLILTTLFFALTSRFEKHRRLARWTAPLWLYVSVTGVAVFLLLKGTGAYHH